MATSTTGYGPDKGRKGDTTYYLKNGQLIARTAHTRHLHKGRTPNVMANRTKMQNITFNWRELKPFIEDCFELPKPTASGYSEFMSLNLCRTEVHLTKTDVKEQVAVADHFVVSHGSLPVGVQVEERDGWMMSDIAVGELPMGLDSSMMEFVTALRMNNPGRFQHGDELMFLRLRQQINMNLNNPIVYAHRVRLSLNNRDPRTVGQALATQFGTEGFEARGGFLATEAHAGDLCTWILLRPQPKGRPKVSTQQLVGRNPLLEKYTSAAHLEEAIKSY